jgi:hypothetical protein
MLRNNINNSNLIKRCGETEGEREEREVVDYHSVPDFSA